MAKDDTKTAQGSGKPTAENTPRHKLIAMGQKPAVEVKGRDVNP